MPAGYDGTVRIDTKLDESGFVHGLRKLTGAIDGSMRDIIRSTKAGTDGMRQSFDKAWESMGWGEKQEVISATIERLDGMGKSFDSLSDAAQRVALSETFDKMNESVSATAETVDKKAAPALRRMNVYGHGFTRILNVMVPGMYRMRRAMVGFNEMSADMNAATTAGNDLASILKLLPVIIIAIGAALAIGLLGLIKWAQRMTDTLYKNLSVTSAMRDKVVQLKGAFNTLKGSVMALGATLLNALAPVLLKIIDWLIKAINWVSMFIAALTGQKTVMQYVSGAADDAAGSTDKLAKETKKAEKAAKGALAAFDEINVLQQDTAELAEEIPDLGGVGGAVGGNIIMQEVEVPDDFVKRTLDNIRMNIEDWINKNVVFPIADKITEWILAIPGIMENAKNWIVETWNNLPEIFGNIWEKIKDIMRAVSDWLRAKWADFDKWFRNITAPWAQWIRDKVTEPIASWFRGAINNILNLFVNLWNSIKAIWLYAAGWFSTNVTYPIRNAFETMLSWLGARWNNVFGGIKDFVRNTVNGIIDILNGMIRGITTGINTAIRALNSIKINMPSWLGGGSFGLNIPTVSAPQIPRLATGAVIPPNAQFAAILGDQRSGTNIETPVKLMEETFARVLAEALADQTFNFNFEGTLGALVRELKPRIDKENARVGTSLIKGSTA